MFTWIEIGRINHPAAAFRWIVEQGEKLGLPICSPLRIDRKGGDRQICGLAAPASQETMANTVLVPKTSQKYFSADA